MRLALGSSLGGLTPSTREALDQLRHEDDRHTIAHFSRLLARHGTSPASLEWNSRESQQRRFAALADVGLADGDSLLDVGCGIGDLVAWLEAEGVSVRYTGVDITPAMVERAQTRFPSLPFYQGCLLGGHPPLPEDAPPFDWVVASGIFAHRRDQPETYIRAMIDVMLARATKGVAVNSLSMRAPHANRWTLFHADPDALLDWAKNHDSVAQAVLREDYDPNDFTLYLYRTKAAARALAWRR
jgi:SAM-dependent methyltransferase